MRRTGRFLGVLLLFLIVAGVLAFLAARSYLSSSGAARQVSRSLESLLGVPVEVDEASLGMIGDSTLRGLRFAEPGEAAEPFLTVDAVETDLTITAALTGSLPRRLTLHGVRLTLRFDSNGKLLTRLPETGEQTGDRPLPSVDLHDVEVILRQEGRPALVISGGEFQLAGEDGTQKLTGTIDDPSWGEWTVSGTVDPQSQAVAAALVAEEVAVTQKQLRALPFVPAEVWEEVQIEGRAALRMNLRYHPGTGDILPRIELTPRAATVHVSAIDLVAREVAGRIVVENGRVNLARIQGQAAGGTVATRGVVDFRGRSPQLRFSVRGDRLEVPRLPRSWRLPVATGWMTGQAQLLVTSRDGKLETSGSGEARIEGVEGATGPVTLTLRSTGDRYRFQPASR